MNPHTDIFIARILLKDNNGFVQILNEMVFSTEDNAYAFLESGFFGRERYQVCMGEIIRFVAGEAEEKTRYSFDKQIVKDKCLEIPMLTSAFVSKYQPGDIVKLNSDYPYKYGVVAAVPSKYEDIPEELREHQEAVYMIEYISERGVLNHMHPEENCLEVADTVPEGEEFLYILSRHYKGIEELPNDIFRAIVEGSIYLLPNRTLNDIGIYLNNWVKCEKGLAYSIFSEQQIAVFDAKAGLLLCNTESGRREYLGRLPNITRFSDIRLYCHAPYICVVEEKGINGAVVNAQTGATKELIRGSYHVEQCRYPIGFVRREEELLLIHSTDWNRLDIMRLNDFANLTERTLTKDSSDDYFHNLIAVSPEGTRFAANGWLWSPFDAIHVYELERFLNEYDNAFYSIEAADHSSGYNWGRPLCWVDENTLAIGRNPNEGMESYLSGAGGEDAVPSLPSRIELYDVARVVEKPYRFEDESGKVLLEGFSKYHPHTASIEFDGFGCDLSYSEVYGNLYFDGKTGVFIGINNSTGLLISRKDGKVTVKDELFKEYEYAPGFRCFYKYSYEKNSVEVIQLDALIETKCCINVT